MRKKEVKARLDAVVKNLEQNIEVTAACGLEVTADLLRMARLDLLCQIHDISDDELQAFIDELITLKPAGRSSVIYLTELIRRRTTLGR